MKHKKFKYEPNSLRLSDLDMPIEFIKNPFVYDNLPDGNYTVSLGNLEYKEFSKVEGHWFLINHSKNDKTFRPCLHAKFNIFPILKHEEYVNLYNNYRRLNKTWKKYVDAYFLWVSFRNVYRETFKYCMRL